MEQNVLLIPSFFIEGFLTFSSKTYLVNKQILVEAPVEKLMIESTESLHIEC